MAERRDEPIAPPRTLTGAAGDDQVILPPPPAADVETPVTAAKKWLRRDKPGATPAPDSSITEPTTQLASAPAGQSRVVRKARLRLVQVEPWSVMKASFLLSVA